MSEAAAFVVFTSWVLLVVEVIAWFAWSPVRDAASAQGATLGLLVLDAALADPLLGLLPLPPPLRRTT